MKKLLLILVILLYFPSIFARFIDGEFQIFVIIISMPAAFIIACINIIYALFGTKGLRSDPKKRQSVSRYILIVKSILVPFFIFNYAIWSMLAGMLLITPGGIIIDLILVPMGICFTYAILLATSSYSISLLFSLYKNGIISGKGFIVHSICQLFFVADIIDQIIIIKLTKVN